MLICEFRSLGHLEFSYTSLKSVFYGIWGWDLRVYTNRENRELLGNFNVTRKVVESSEKLPKFPWSRGKLPVMTCHATAVFGLQFEISVFLGHFLDALALSDVTNKKTKKQIKCALIARAFYGSFTENLENRSRCTAKASFGGLEWSSPLSISISTRPYRHSYRIRCLVNSCNLSTLLRSWNDVKNRYARSTEVCSEDWLQNEVLLYYCHF